MIRLSVFYPKGEDATFDHDYYRNQHVPLCVKTWQPESAQIDRGLDGPYIAAVHIVFKSEEALKEAFASPSMGEIMGDIANYTNVSPVIQTSEIVEGA
jgi:uncharacterized protein (TIGR02118 family)